MVVHAATAVLDQRCKINHRPPGSPPASPLSLTLTHERAEPTPLQFVGGKHAASEVYGC